MAKSWQHSITLTAYILTTSLLCCQFCHFCQGYQKNSGCKAEMLRLLLQCEAGCKGREPLPAVAVRGQCRSLAGAGPALAQRKAARQATSILRQSWRCMRLAAYCQRAPAEAVYRGPYLIAEAGCDYRERADELLRGHKLAMQGKQGAQRVMSALLLQSQSACTFRQWLYPGIAALLPFKRVTVVNVVNVVSEFSRQRREKSRQVQGARAPSGSGSTRPVPSSLAGAGPALAQRKAARHA